MKNVIFREVQKPRQIWVWVIVMFIATLMWYGFIQQILLGIPFGDKPAPDLLFIIFWIIFGIIFPGILIFYIKLIIEVRDDGVYIKYLPFHRHYRNFMFHELEHYEVTQYNSMEFGGWGIRLNATGGKAYSMSGKKAVELQLKNQKPLVIGSQSPEDIVKAIDSAIEGGKD